MWLIMPVDWLLAGGRKMEATFTLSTPTTGMQLKPLHSGSKNINGGVCFQGHVYPERAAELAVVFQLYPALSLSCASTPGCWL